jgi:hypothetical protein
MAAGSVLDARSSARFHPSRGLHRSSSTLGSFALALHQLKDDNSRRQFGSIRADTSFERRPGVEKKLKTRSLEQKGSPMEKKTLVPNHNATNSRLSRAALTKPSKIAPTKVVGTRVLTSKLATTKSSPGVIIDP